MEFKPFKENPKSSSTSFVPLQGPGSKHVDCQKDYKNIPTIYVLGIKPLLRLLATVQPDRRASLLLIQFSANMFRTTKKRPRVRVGKLWLLGQI